MGFRCQFGLCRAVLACLCGVKFRSPFRLRRCVDILRVCQGFAHFVKGRILRAPSFGLTLWDRNGVNCVCRVQFFGNVNKFVTGFGGA